MATNGIVDRTGLDTWLRRRSGVGGGLIGHRAGLYVLPIGLSWLSSDAAKRMGVTALPVFRVALTLGVAQRFSSPWINDAIGKARSDAEIAAGIASGAAFNATQAPKYGSPDAAAYAACKAIYALVQTYPDDAAADASLAEASALENPGVANSAVWHQVQSDCNAIESGALTPESRLWDRTPFWVARDWSIAKTNMSGEPAWTFWTDWFDRVLDGAQQDWPLLNEVALIRNDVWEAGPDAVAAAIREIAGASSGGAHTEGALDTVLEETPVGSATSVRRVGRAFQDNRAELPPTFDAVLGFISLEIERLQSRNYRDDDDKEESLRQIRVLSVLHEAIVRLRALVPVDDPMPEEQAMKADKLLRVFVRKYEEWPRTNADELVDMTYRGALIGATTVMLPLAGVATHYALAAGLVFFGGKRLLEAAKAAKDLMSPGT